MILTGNTIFITGGGSGIGRGLAEALHKRGNLVIISGRRKSHLEATTKANPGMVSVELDLQDPKSIASVAKKLIAQYPKLNVLINNRNGGSIGSFAQVACNITGNLTIQGNAVIGTSNRNDGLGGGTTGTDATVNVHANSISVVGEFDSFVSANAGGRIGNLGLRCQVL